MQGAFAEHVRALEGAGARTRLVRTREDLQGLDGLVLPGGESTTMTMLMERVGLLEPVREVIEHGLPVLATCAGMIVLANEITGAMEGQHGLGLLDIDVRRNGYGRQVDSFEAGLDIEGLPGAEFTGVFIRAPLVESFRSHRRRSSTSPRTGAKSRDSSRRPARPSASTCGARRSCRF